MVESFLSGDEAVSEGKMEGAGSRFLLRAFPPPPSRLANPRGGSEATNGKSVCAQRGERTGRWLKRAKFAVERNRSHDEGGATSVAH